MLNKFWTGYLLFFIFIFPMIFEYIPRIASDSYGFGISTSPWMAITYLTVGAIAWICFIYWYYSSHIKPIGRVYNQAKAILKDGKPVVAHIEKVRIQQEMSGYQVLDLEISFKNLAGTLVHIPYEINDSKPEQRRYGVGDFINMRLDTKLRSPTILPEDVQISKTNETTRNHYLGFIGLIAFCVLYLIFSYWLQSEGTGWRFLHFWHPWVTIPFWGLLFGWMLLDLLIGKLSSIFDGNSENETLLVFKGKPAYATIIDANQTGTYINEQPEIQFKLEFIDDKGQLRTANFKKIVSLMHLHKIDLEERLILYSPDNPQEVMFAEDYVRN